MLLHKDKGANTFLLTYLLSSTQHNKEKQVPGQNSTLSNPFSTVARKNFPLTARNLEQNQAPCRQPSVSTAWDRGIRGDDETDRGEEETEKREGERREAEDRSNIEQKQQDTGRAMERI